VGRGDDAKGRAPPIQDDGTGFNSYLCSPIENNKPVETCHGSTKEASTNKLNFNTHPDHMDKVDSTHLAL